MFKEWLTENKLEKFLIKQADFHPYPKIEDRDEWEKISCEAKKELLAEADKYLNFEYPALPATYFMAAYFDGNRRIYEKPHFERRMALRALVLGECVENKGKYINDIINGIWCICEESFWGVSAHNGVNDLARPPLPDVENHYVDLFAGETAALLAWTLYLMRDKLDDVTPQISRRIDYEMDKRVKTPVYNRRDFWWMGYTPKRVNNWNPWVASNMITTFLILETNEKRRAEAIEKLMDMLDSFLKMYGVDGGCDEGTSYWNRAGGALFDFLDLLYKATDGKVSFFAEPIIKEIGRYISRSHIAEEYFINFADGAAIANTCDDMIYRYGKSIDDKGLMSMAASRYTGKKAKEEASLYCRDGLQHSLPAIFNEAEISKAENKAPYFKNMYLSDIKVMAAREKAGSTNGLYIAAKGGHNFESHNHNDIGNFILYLNGMPALIDVGVTEYTIKTFSPYRYDIWTMQSAYHNVPLINGEMQVAGKEYRAENAEYYSSNTKTDFTLNIEKAYPEKAGVISYRRSFELEDNKGIKITDCAKFEKESNAITLNFMSWKEPKIDSDGIVSIKTSENDVLYIKYLSGASVSFEKKDTLDPNLVKVWGEEGVWRTSIAYINLDKEVKLEVEITNE